MSGLVEFLRARLDEDEAVALAATGGDWHVTVQKYDEDFKAKIGSWAEGGDIAGHGYEGGGVDTVATAQHMARHRPARVLAEVEAKRRLLAGVLAEPHATLRPGGSTEIYCAADSGLGDPCECGRDARVSAYVRLLALPYAYHPDYDERWRP